MWFVYVLLCTDGSLYTGVTNDLPKRFSLHQSGRGAKYTRSHLPQKIIFQQTFPTRSTAQQRESEIKSWSHTQKITNLNLASILTTND